jgi:phosphatidate phosphatase PAH1
LKRWLWAIFTGTTLAQALDVVLQWDPSPSPDVVEYIIYAHTNSFSATTLSNATVRVSVGTNLTTTVTGLSNTNRWYFVATAKDKYGLESLPSNEVNFALASPPQDLRLLILEGTTNLSSGWTNLGFFRLRIP